MRHVHHARTHNHLIYTICFLAFIFTLHSTLPVYINSTFLSQFTTERVVSLLYSVGAALSVVGLLVMPSLERRFGNYHVSMALIFIEMLALAGIVVSKSVITISPFFLLALVMINLISFTFDIFLDAHTDNGHTGSIRGLFMTAVNTAWILSPILASSLITSNDYWKIYLASIGLLFPLLYMLRKNFRHFHDPHYPHLAPLKTLKAAWKNKDIRLIFIINIFLNTFYAWMVIYSPIYLHNHVGFDWDSIGLILTVMLIPFIIFELPFGKLADEKYGEKEILTAGFIIMGLATIGMAYISGANVWVWALVLFISRIGASLAEIMIETYFFKKVHPHDSNMLSMFRITRPVSTFLAPFLTLLLEPFLPYNYLFFALGIFTLIALWFIVQLRDTK